MTKLIDYIQKNVNVGVSEQIIDCTYMYNYRSYDSSIWSEKVKY